MDPTGRAQWRKQIRLPRYDYSTPGEYFVTICTAGMSCILGEVRDARMHPNEIGRIVEAVWHDIPRRDPWVRLDAFTLMPNHIHGILCLGIEDAPGMPRVARRTPLADIVGAFKSRSARAVNARVRPQGWRLWQRGYYEHIIRTDRALRDIRGYIDDNPATWTKDPYHPARTAGGASPGPTHRRHTAGGASPAPTEAPFPPPL